MTTGPTRILNAPCRTRAIYELSGGTLARSKFSRAMRELLLAVGASLLAGSGAIIALIVIQVGS